MTLKELYELGGIFGVISGVLWFAVRSLISFAYEKKTEIEELKNDHLVKSIEELKSITHQFEESLSAVKDDIIRITEKMRNGQEAQKSVMDALGKFVDATNARFKSIESEIVTIGKDLIMVRGKAKR